MVDGASEDEEKTQERCGAEGKDRLEALRDQRMRQIWRGAIWCALEYTTKRQLYRIRLGKGDIAEHTELLDSPMRRAYDAWHAWVQVAAVMAYEAGSRVFRHPFGHPTIAANRAS